MGTNATKIERDNMAAHFKIPEIQAQNERGNVKYAGLFVRTIAFVLDSVLVMVLFVPLSFLVFWLFGWLFGFSGLVFLLNMIITILFLNLAYFGYFTYLTVKNGQTLGQKLMRIKVVDSEGNKITYTNALLRTVSLFFLTSIPFIFVNVIVLYADKQKRAMHDMLAKSYVIHEQ